MKSMQHVRRLGVVAAFFGGLFAVCAAPAPGPDTGSTLSLMSLGVAGVFGLHTWLRRR